MTVKKSISRHTDVPYQLAMLFFSGMTQHEDWEMYAGVSDGQGHTIQHQTNLHWSDGGQNGTVPCTEQLTATRTDDGTKFELSAEAVLDSIPADLRSTHATDLQSYVDDGVEQIVQALRGNFLD